MHYYTHNIGDYAIATSCMTFEEKGVYVDMVDRYISTGKPLDTQWLSIFKRKAGEDAVNNVLTLCFVERDGFFYREELDRMIAAYAQTTEKNRRNAQKRRKDVAPEPTGLVSETQTKPSGYPVGSLTNNQEPITKNQIRESTDVLSTQAQAPASTPVRKRKTSGVSSVEKPDEIPAQVWSDWLQIRKAKRLPLTKTAWDAMLLEAEKVGYSAEEMVRCCVERGWASFKAQWLINEKEKNERAAGMPPKANRPLQRQDLEDLEEVPL
jgi:uncharacterized protein YdaU (DUF1376 family)